MLKNLNTVKNKGVETLQKDSLKKDPKQTSKSQNKNGNKSEVSG